MSEASLTMPGTYPGDTGRSTAMVKGVGDELTVSVPYDLAWDLVDEGFGQAEQLRGLDWLPQGVVLAVTVVGVTADLTTLVLAKDSISRFVHRVAGWATGQAKNVPLNELTLRLDIVHPADTRSDRHIKMQISRPDAFSDKEISEMTSFITAVFSDDLAK